MAYAHYYQGYRSALHVSSDLGPGPWAKKALDGQLAFQEFVADHLETGCLMSVALVLTHPEQYAVTRAALEKLSTVRHICERIREWSFGFHVLTVVVNRESLLHRDKRSGGFLWLDLLLTIGGDDGTVLELPGLGVRFQYSSGTFVLFSGNTHLHGVSASEAERVCFAAYARPSVNRQFPIHSPKPPTIERSSHHAYWLTYIHSLLEWARK